MVAWPAGCLGFFRQGLVRPEHPGEGGSTSMNGPALAIRRAVRRLTDAEREDLRGGIRRLGRVGLTCPAGAEREWTNPGCSQAFRPGVDAGFRGETVEERLSAVG